jgi:hypothetical protein
MLKLGELWSSHQEAVSDVFIRPYEKLLHTDIKQAAVCRRLQLKKTKKQKTNLQQTHPPTACRQSAKPWRLGVLISMPRATAFVATRTTKNHPRFGVVYFVCFFI